MLTWIVTEETEKQHEGEGSSHMYIYGTIFLISMDYLFQKSACNRMGQSVSKNTLMLDPSTLHVLGD